MNEEDDSQEIIVADSFAAFLGFTLGLGTGVVIRNSGMYPEEIASPYWITGSAGLVGSIIVIKSLYDDALLRTSLTENLGRYLKNVIQRKKRDPDAEREIYRSHNTILRKNLWVRFTGSFLIGVAAGNMISLSNEINLDFSRTLNEPQ